MYAWIDQHMNKRQIIIMGQLTLTKLLLISGPSPNISVILLLLSTILWEVSYYSYFIVKEAFWITLRSLILEELDSDPGVRLSIPHAASLHLPLSTTRTHHGEVSTVDQLLSGCVLVALGIPKTFLGTPWGQNYFIKDERWHLIFFSLLFPDGPTLKFSRAYV